MYRISASSEKLQVYIKNRTCSFLLMFILIRFVFASTYWKLLIEYVKRFYFTFSINIDIRTYR